VGVDEPLRGTAYRYLSARYGANGANGANLPNGQSEALRRDTQRELHTEYSIRLPIALSCFVVA
jgi:hypothetical protein